MQHLFSRIFKSCGSYWRDLFAILAIQVYQDYMLKRLTSTSSVLERRKTNNIRVHETSSCDSEGNFLPSVRKIIIWGFLWRYSDQRSTTRGILLEKAQHAHRRKCVLFVLDLQSVSQQQVSIELYCYSAFSFFNQAFIYCTVHRLIAAHALGKYTFTLPHKIFRTKFKIYVFELHIKSIQFDCSFIIN